MEEKSRIFLTSVVPSFAFGFSGAGFMPPTTFTSGDLAVLLPDLALLGPTPPSSASLAVAPYESVLVDPLLHWIVPKQRGGGGGARLHC